MLKFSRRLGLVALLFFALLSILLSIPRPVAAHSQVVVNMTASIVKKAADGKIVGGWDPKKITVTEGDKVVIRLKSVDVEHVFSLEGYNIEKDVSPGKPVEIRFVANKVGIFNYHCGMECGPLHKAMIGQLIVNKKG